MFIGKLPDFIGITSIPGRPTSFQRIIQVMKQQHCKIKLHNLTQEQINTMRNGRDGFRTKRERIPIPKKYQTLGRR